MKTGRRVTHRCLYEIEIAESTVEVISGIGRSLAYEFYRFH